jgi:hypothetical protein
MRRSGQVVLAIVLLWGGLSSAAAQGPAGELAASRLARSDRVMFAPLMDLRGLIGVGPRVADHTVNSIPMYPFPAYEDVRLKTP